MAEGVETGAQLDKLRELRCMQLQGYLYSRPIPIEQVELMLAAPAPLAGAGSAAAVLRTALASARPKRRPKRR